VAALAALSVGGSGFAQNPPSTTTPKKAGMAPVNPGLMDVNIAQKFNNLGPLNDLLKNVQVTKTEDKKALLRALPNSDMFVYVLDAASAAKLGLTVLTAEAKSQNTIIVQDFIMYRDVEDKAEKKQYRVGIGIRLFITVNQKSSSMATASIPWLALQADSKKLQARIRLQVLGIQGKKVTEAAPLPSELNFTTLSQMYLAVDNIKKAIWDDEDADDGTSITPQVVAVSDQDLKGPTEPK
jgi:hypothetical protein